MHGLAGDLFAISGFLICTRLLEERHEAGRISLKSFYLRRAFRILPPYFLYLAILAWIAAAGVVEVAPIEWWSCGLFFRNYIPDLPPPFRHAARRAALGLLGRAAAGHPGVQGLDRTLVLAVGVARSDRGAHGCHLVSATLSLIAVPFLLPWLLVGTVLHPGHAIRAGARARAGALGGEDLL